MLEILQVYKAVTCPYHEGI